MSSDTILLACVNRVSSEEIHFVELVKLHRFGQGQIRACSRVFYMCLGKRCVHFVLCGVDEELTDELQLPYLEIAGAVSDPSVGRLFKLRLQAGSTLFSSWCGASELVVESDLREALLHQVASFWQAESMLQTFRVKRFQVVEGHVGGLAPHGQGLADAAKMILPFAGYEEAHCPGGYSFWLRSGFDAAGPVERHLCLFSHPSGWASVRRGSQLVSVPPAVQVSVCAGDERKIAALGAGAGDKDALRQAAAAFRQSIAEELDDFYVLLDQPYMKRMNRSGDIAKWEGWEFKILGQEHLYSCVFFRRSYIPPLCESSRDLVVLVRCPAHDEMREDLCDALQDECRFIGDSLSPTAAAQNVHRKFLQARMDALHCDEEAFAWFQMQLQMSPYHRPAAVAFVHSIVRVLVQDGLLLDAALLESRFFAGSPTYDKPLSAPQGLLMDVELLYLSAEAEPRRRGRLERRLCAWYARVARYFAFCVDGGFLGDRLRMTTLVEAFMKGHRKGYNEDIRAVIDFLLHAVPLGTRSTSPLGSYVPLLQLLQKPEGVANYRFNERVMKVLISTECVKQECRMFPSGVAAYEKFLAAMVSAAEDVFGLDLRMLICRQMLELTSGKDAVPLGEEQAYHLVPALVEVLHGGCYDLASVATAVLVNLSCGRESIKSCVLSEGILSVAVKQLRLKDEDLTLYTLYLLVNLTKSVSARAVFRREAGVPAVIGLLTSSYQCLGRHKILTEVCSVLGHLAKDSEARAEIRDGSPAIACLLFVNDSAPCGSKLKAKLHFALRQLLRGPAEHKVRVGKHLLFKTLDELGQSSPNSPDCIVSAVLFLTVLAGSRANAMGMLHQNRLEEALERCGIQHEGVEREGHRFGAHAWDKVMDLKDRLQEMEYACKDCDDDE